MEKMLNSRLLDFSGEQNPPALNSSNSSSPSQSEDVYSPRHRFPYALSEGRVAAGTSRAGNAIAREGDLRLHNLPFKDVVAEGGTSLGGSSLRLATSKIETSSSTIPDLGTSLGQHGTLPGSYLDRNWATNLLLECAKAVSEKEMPRVQHLLWIVNELASPYGDADQRTASYFLQALFCKITGTGPRCYRILCSAVERNYSFDSMRKLILKFQEASPWTTFGHVAANGAILEAFDGEMRVHIVDLSNTFCTQWPTLLEALATRPDGAPHLRLTTVTSAKEASGMKVMKEVGTRLEKFARLMGVPFEFNVIQELELGKLHQGTLDLRSGEALAINCIQSLHHVTGKESTGAEGSPRDLILSTFRNMNPKIVTVIEDEVELLSEDFMPCFSEALRFYSLFLDSLEESFPRASNERLMLERGAARSLVNLLACDACDETEDCERREKGSQWATRLQQAGFAPTAFSDDVVDDVRALLKRYKEGWGLTTGDNGLFLTWKDESVIFASAWKMS